MPSATASPHWDLDFLFVSPTSPAFREACETCFSRLEALGRQFEALGIQRGATDPNAGETFAQAADALNRYLFDQRKITAYLHGLVTTNSQDEAAQAAESEFEARTTLLPKLTTALTAWIGAQDVDAMLDNPVARAHEWMIRKAKMASAHLMSSAEEGLAADLSLTGSNAWDKLHGNLTSQYEVRVGEERIPISVARNRAFDPDREVRREAYLAEITAWKEIELPMAACMNGVKGEVEMLTKRRGWSSPVAMACFNANIDEATLDAMMFAAHESFPAFRRYLRAKARKLGVEKLAWFDMFAPLPGEGRTWDFDEAVAFVESSFGAFSPKMAEFARSMVTKRRIDAEPRPGKRDGAYCMGVPPAESLILMNFKPAFGSVSTLAHELGHGYHNLCLEDRTILQRSTPMTLAETASIFCETIIRQTVLRGEFSAEDKLAVLEASLQGSCQTVVDITSRFIFERALFAKRAERELSAAEMNELMLDAQRETYGDGLDPEFLHPYMWAVKPHYYGATFYNFPYMFGLLFGLGLYAIYEKDPEGFKARYDDLLSSTGLADAATLAGTFGIDIRSPEFWRGSLNTVAADVARFESLV